MYTEKNLTNEFNLKIEKNHSMGSASKKVIIMIIMLFLLLIPSGLINAIVREREARSQGVVTEISDSWGQAQQYVGPILSIPYETYRTERVFDKDAKGNRRAVNKHVSTGKSVIHIMPEGYKVNCTMIPKEKSRGIFKATLYSANAQTEALFLKRDVEKFLGRKNIQLNYKKAYLTLGISDMNKIEKNIIATANGKKLNVKPGSTLSWSVPSGVTIPVDASPLELNKPLNIHTELQFKGSSTLSIPPIGQTNEIVVESKWKHPSFSGTYLPETPVEGDEKKFKEGFRAQWKIFNYDRSAPQLFKSDDPKYTKKELTVGLVQSVEGYQKVSRTTKYAILFILLTFVTFFLIEIKNKKPLHPIQYLLIGLAVSIFYALLLSITEQTTFGIAYFAASSAVTLLITGYSHSVFKNHKVTMIVLGSFTSLYGILYTILQQEDKALLFGSISLFVALAMVMFFTRDIDWYNIGKKESSLDFDEE